MATHPLFSESKPNLIKELVPDQNDHLDLRIVRENSGIKALWQCSKNPIHQWETPIRNRAISGYGCPFCSGRRTHPSESFAALHPEIAAELHPSRNPELDPTTIAPNSNKRVWWQCHSEFKHEWETSVATRVRNKSRCKACLHIKNPLPSLQHSLSQKGILGYRQKASLHLRLRRFGGNVLSIRSISGTQ